MEGNPLTLRDLVEGAQDLKRRLGLARQKFAAVEAPGTAGSGLVTVVMIGAGEITRPPNHSAR